MWSDFLSAFALFLIFEGILPFVDPKQWRRAMFTLFQLNDRILRVLGLSSMIMGVAILYYIRP